MRRKSCACSCSNDNRNFYKVQAFLNRYLGVLLNERDFPENDERCGKFQTVKALCNGLNMSHVSAAQFIYQELHQPHHRLFQQHLQRLC